MIQDFIQYVSANMELIVSIALFGGIVSFCLRGVKRVASIFCSIIMLLVVLNWLGVPMEDIKSGIESVGEYVQSDQISGAIDSVKSFWEKGEDVTEQLIDEESDKESDKSGNDLADWIETGDENTYAAVHFINVGQADCSLIQNGNDTILIDCGNYDDAATVIDYLSGLGIDQIDYFILSHPHEDHIGSAAAVINAFDVDTVIEPSVEASTQCYAAMRAAVQNKEVTDYVIDEQTPIGNTELWTLENSYFEILGPISTGKEEVNNNSLVVRYTYGNTSFLFTGDAERIEELEILDAGYDVAATVLKVGHHGSDTSTSYPWLRAIMPELAVICVGKDNNYGHPDDNTLSKLRDADAQVYRTDLNGTIVMQSNGEQVLVYTEK